MFDVLLHIIIVGVIIGLVAWLVLRLIPLAPPFPAVVQALAGILFLVYALEAFGLLHGHF